MHYLTSNSICRNLDEKLDATRQADCDAYTAYLLSRVAPLVDLSLYLSAANWSATTRPAYSSLLSFPLTWTLPPLIRAEAIKRATNLGLADLDTDFDPNGSLHLSAGRDALPQSLTIHLPARTKKTVREEMTPEQAAAIRLSSLTQERLSILVAAMDQGSTETEQPRFFSSTPISSADCLAYGFLALMVKPQVPRPFLRDWLETSAPQLIRFVDSITLQDVPCSSPETSPMSTTIGRTVDSAIRNMPGLGLWYSDEMRRRGELGATGFDQRALALMMGFVVTGTVFGYGLYVYKLSQPFGARSQIWTAWSGGSKLSQFGELGSMLNFAMGAHDSALELQSGGPTGAVPTSAANGRFIDVDSEVD